MPINITKALNEIQSRLDDSTQTGTDLNRLISIANRANNSGINALTYRSTGHLPSTADSNYIGFMAYVASDNVFGDSSGRFYYASNRDSGWIAITTAQDSDEGTILDASGPSAPTTNPSGGTAYGYALAGFVPGDPAAGNIIERFSFTSDGNSADVGDFGVSVYSIGVGQSSTHGYSLGGHDFTAPTYYTNIVQKFSFAASGNSTTLSYTVGERDRVQSGVHTTPTHAFTAGGYRFPVVGFVNSIDKYSYTDDTNSVVTGGTLSAANADFAGQMSETHGYLTGGTPSVNPDVGFIYKYPFAISSGNESLVGDLTPQYTTQHEQTGASSSTHGYTMGGTIINAIEKFPFAADANSTDVGNLAQTAWQAGSTQSTTYGYNIGGTSPSVSVNNIQKIDFSSDGDGTDIGDLTVARTKLRGAAE